MELNRYIDHTLLKADATPEQIAKLCAEAKDRLLQLSPDS